jgi:hypothetical protein
LLEDGFDRVSKKDRLGAFAGEVGDRFPNVSSQEQLLCPAVVSLIADLPVVALNRLDRIHKITISENF